MGEMEEDEDVDEEASAGWGRIAACWRLVAHAVQRLGASGPAVSVVPT